MRRAAFHRSLSRLALVAGLLLATLPTLGRLASHAHPHGDAQVAHAGAMAHAMAMPHGHAMPPERTRTPGPAPAPHAHALDCAYCALLAGVIPHAALAPTVIRAPPVRPLVPPRASVPFVATAAGGLGARGPPRAA